MRNRKALKRPPAGAATKGMVVVLSGDRPTDEVIGDLRAAGFEIDQVLGGIGQVIGKAVPGLKHNLESIPGVANVSEMHQDFDIGPPGAPVS